MTSPPPPEVTVPEASFDAQWVSTIVEWIMEDVATVDERLLDRPEFGGSYSLGVLAKNLSSLLDENPPPGVDVAHYYALAQTLSETFDHAADILDIDVIEGAATYTVGRNHLQELLDLLNPALGTNHQLPVWAFR